jgi:hypothetical protein
VLRILGDGGLDNWYSRGMGRFVEPISRGHAWWWLAYYSYDAPEENIVVEDDARA